jgi:hypothetical protein
MLPERSKSRDWSRPCQNGRVTIQVKNHLPALRLRQAGEWTRIHTNEGEGIGTPVSDPARYKWEVSDCRREESLCPAGDCYLCAWRQVRDAVERSSVQLIWRDPRLEH